MWYPHVSHNIQLQILLRNEKLCVAKKTFFCKIKPGEHLHKDDLPSGKEQKRGQPRLHLIIIGFLIFRSLVNSSDAHESISLIKWIVKICHPLTFSQDTK